MKRNLLRCALATAMALTVSPALAEDRPIAFGYLGIQGSYYDIEKGRDRLGDVHNFWQPAAQIGWRFSRLLSAQLQYGQADTEMRRLNEDVESRLGTLSLRLHAWNWSIGAFHPYVGVGYGHHELRPDTLRRKTEDSALAELGVQWWMGQHWMGDLGVRGLFESDDRFADTQGYLALNWVFGQRHAPRPVVMDPAPLPPPEPAEPAWVDSDGDGVPDHLDRCPATPAGALVDEQGCHLVQQEPVNLTLYLEFDHDSTVVKSQYIPEIRQVADVLIQYPDSEVLLEGHTDSTGSARYNQTLSQSRADAVMKVLVSEFGIGPERIRTSGMGKSQPIADNGTAEGRARNRRVEAVVKAVREEIRMR